jgi:hypothetical protein
MPAPLDLVVKNGRKVSSRRSGGFNGATVATGGLLEVGDATHPGAALGGTVNVGVGGASREANAGGALFTSLGARFGTSYDLAGGKLMPWISLSWEHASDTVSAAQGLAFSTGPAFSVTGALIGRDALAVQIGAGLKLAGFHLNLLYAGRNGGVSEVAVPEGLR